MPTPRFLAFWSLNCPLEPTRLRRQIEAFRDAGMDGVVFHPRFYPDDPPYLGPGFCARMSELILRARDLGLACWLYDENGWPSGTVGGRMLRERPEVRQQWVELVETEPADCLAAFEREDGRRWFVARRLGPGVDYLNPALAEHFLSLTHERYRAGLDPAAFAHVEAFFCDEPEFGLGHVHHELSLHGAIPWTADLPELFQQRYGADLLALLPVLFLGGKGSGEARVNFWELLRDRFCAGFLAPLDAWCRRHGKRHAAHIKGEEHPLFQVPMVGSCHAVFRHLSLPGLDALGRLPGNDYFPRQLASEAAQFGDGRCMAEAFGGAGWGATPGDLERYLLWLGGHGITDFVLHLSQARLDSAAIRDWPPSQPLHLNWSEAYPEVLRRVRVALAGRSQAADAPDLLVVSPHRGIMETFAPWELPPTNIHDAATYPDTPAGRLNDRFLALVADLNARGIAHHFADEATLEMGALEGGALRVGRCAYRRVLLAEGTVLNAAGRKLVETLGGAFSLPEPITEVGTETRDRHEIVTLPVAWGMPPLTRWNHCVLEARPDGPARWQVEFRTPGQAGAMQLRFADAVTDVKVNGRDFPVASTREGLDGGTTVDLKGLTPATAVSVRFQTGAAQPFVWVEGAFLVESGAPFVPGPNGTVQTAGPFTLRWPGPMTASVLPPAEFVAGGHPFARGPVVIEGTFTCDRPIEAGWGLSLDGIQADAAGVWVDGRDLGFAWGPGWGVPLVAPLAAGEHRVRLALVPSTFNFFGPHHHFGGDRPVVSPAQFSGRKNFADPLDASDPTLVAAWHFKPLAAPRALQLEATWPRP